MNSWSTKTDYSLFHLELDPSHYGQWSEMSTAECKSDYWFTRYVTSFLNSILNSPNEEYFVRYTRAQTINPG